MPPKRASKKTTKAAATPKEESNDEVTPPKDASRDEARRETAGDDTKPSKKRKTPAPAEQEEPSKSARRSARSAPKTQATHTQLLNYLLSIDAQELCRPEDESQDLKDRGADIKTYSTSLLTPFEELLCAVILSRPISHRLGLRSIRTVLNAPYGFTTPRAIREAGEEKCHRAMWDARTQHKGKTAEEISRVADVVLDKFTSKADPDGTQLRKLLDDSDGDVDQALDTLKASIKGLGATGLNIFLRRVQWVEGWKAGYPFVDEKTGLALRKLGLPEEGEDLRKLLEGCWGDLKETRGLAGEGEEKRKRRAFVVVLERAVGAELEGKVDEVAAAAAKA